MAVSDNGVSCHEERFLRCEDSFTDFFRHPIHTGGAGAIEIMCCPDMLLNCHSSMCSLEGLILRLFRLSTVGCCSLRGMRVENMHDVSVRNLFFANQIFDADFDFDLHHAFEFLLNHLLFVDRILPM